MKAILMSIKPKYVAKILNGEKTLEIRKSFTESYRGWVYIYSTKQQSLARLNNGHLKDTFICEKDITEDDFKRMYSGYDGKGKVVARFYCDTVEHHRCIVNIAPSRKKILYKSCDLSSEKEEKILQDILKKSCLFEKELATYLEKESNAFSGFYAIHISELEIFDEPKELWEFETTKQHLVGVIGQTQPILQNTRLTKAPQSRCYIEVD